MLHEQRQQVVSELEWWIAGAARVLGFKMRRKTAPIGRLEKSLLSAAQSE